MSYDLFDDIEMPKRVSRGPVSKFPFADMNVNQSFYVTPNAGETNEKLLRRMRSNAARARKSLGDRKFAVRVTTHPSTQEPCVGVWRIE